MEVLYIGEPTNNLIVEAKNKGITLFTKPNALEAKIFIEEQEDLSMILCEYELPGNNGLFFFDEIRESGIPFILLTKDYVESIYKTAFEKGVADYFVISSTSSSQIFERVFSLYEDLKKPCLAKVNSNSGNGFKLPLSKRIFDVTVASLILFVLSPLLLIITVAIKLESKGKVYYIAKRVGRKTFDFYKLRSMRTGSDKMLKKLAKESNQYGSTSEMSIKVDHTCCPKCKELPSGTYCSPLNYVGILKICDYWYNKQKEEVRNNSASFVKILDDPRITRIGKFIRNTSIDELPQLINVIKGDMSLVGNRPLPVYEAELLTQDQMSKRFLAPAGITGLWQVELRGKGGDMSEEERISLDNKYADYFIGNNYSFWFDMKILLRTVPALFQSSTV